MNNTWQAWKGALQQLSNTWKANLLVHLGFTAIRVILLAPLLGLTGKFLLKLSGQGALSDQDIAYFFLTPTGLFSLILFASLSITVLVFELAVLMHIARASADQQPISYIEALRRTALQLPALWLYTANLVIRLLILILPLLAIAGLLAWWLISEHDINYYLDQKPREFLLAASLIGVLVLCFLAILLRKLMQWALSLPLLLFAGSQPGSAFTKSAQILNGHRFSVLLIAASWATLMLSAGLGLLGLTTLCAQFLIPLASTTLELAVFLLGGLFVLWSIASILLTAFTWSTLSALLVGLHEKYSAPGKTTRPPTFSSRSVSPPSPLTVKSLTVGLIVCTIAAGLTGVWFLNSIPVDNKIKIAAHRGAAGKAPENTFAAVEQAITDQTDWVEIDVQETADGTVVLAHDSDFMKLASNPVKMWEVHDEQLDEIDIGSWFDPAFSDQRVPGLKEVLERVKGKAKLLIELKYYGHDKNLEQAVIDLVEQTGMVDQVAIMSLQYEGIQKVRRLRPEWKIGLLSATSLGNLNSLDTDFLAIAKGMASASLIKRAHQAGREVLVWTVNDALTMSRMISLGVDGIITDEPALARKVVTEHEQLNTAQRLLVHIAFVFGTPQTLTQYRDNSP